MYMRRLTGRLELAHCDTCRGEDYVPGTDALDAVVIREIFEMFMHKVATPSRPFYYHNDDAKLQLLFEELRANPDFVHTDPQEQDPTVLPLQ
jgi:hypothetical protein